MSKKVTIGTSQYTLSQSGDEKGWGESQSDLLQAIIDSVNGFFGPGDILPTSTGIANGTGTLGTVDATTGTPTLNGAGSPTTVLIDGTGTAGDSYKISVAGSYDYGSGLIIFQADQYIVYSGTIWEKKDSPSIINNAPITFFQFDGNIVSFFEADYTVIRSDNADTLFEAGKIFGTNDPNDGWYITIQKQGENESGVFFDINASGQVNYTSDFMIGVYSTSASKISFKVKSIVK